MVYSYNKALHALRFKFFLTSKRLAKGIAASNLRRNFSSHVTEFGFRIEIFARGIRNHGIFCLWNQESWPLEPGIAQENQNPLMFGIQKPRSTNKDWNPKQIVRNPWR